MPLRLQLLLLLLPLWASAGGLSPFVLCPSGCRCLWLEHDCASAGLGAAPAGLWPGVWSLRLDANNLSALPAASLAGYPALTALSIDDNAFARLDLNAFASVWRLADLSVARNVIADIVPLAEGAVLPALSTLVLSFNELQVLDPDIFVPLPELRYLHLDGNPLLLPSDTPLLSHGGLSTLSLDKTDASSISSVTLSGLPNLQTLRLNATNARNLSGAFLALPRLSSLTVSSNDVVRVTADAFAPGTRLDFLDLDDNPLTTMEAGALFSLKNGAVLSLRDTPMACECAYSMVLLWAHVHDVVVRTTCSSGRPCLQDNNASEDKDASEEDTAETGGGDYSIEAQIERNEVLFKDSRDAFNRLELVLSDISPDDSSNSL